MAYITTTPESEPSTLRVEAEKSLTISTKVATLSSSVSGVCDCCSTKAFYIAIKGRSSLCFCGHHARHNANSLLERGFTITPDTYSFKK